MMTKNTPWECDCCQDNCGEATNTFGSFLCIYAFLIRKPETSQKMWFKEHSPDRRELISTDGKVIAIWSSQRGHWRIRTNKDYVKDWEEYGNETGDVFISGEDIAFNLAFRIL